MTHHFASPLHRIFAPAGLVVTALAFGACVSDDEGDEPGQTSAQTSTQGDDDPVGLAACKLPVAEPKRVAITTTDFSTGAVGLASVYGRVLENDLALGSTDMAGYHHEGRVYLVNRFGADYVDILDPAKKLASLGQFAITAAVEGSPNPYSIAFDPRGQAYVSLFGAPELQIFDVSNPAQVVQTGAVDLSAFSDGDGNPELGATVACGDYLWTSAERLDPDWVPTGTTWLVGVDTFTGQPLATSNGTGPGTVELLGAGIHGYRADPQDPSGTTLLVLTAGLERVDLATGTTNWVIDQAVFEAAGLSRLQLSAFDLHTDGTVYISAASPDWSAFGIWRASLGAQGSDLVQVVGELQSVTGDMLVTGNELWFLDTTIGASGVRVFDLSVDPVAELTTGAMTTGLPPHTLVALP